MMMMINDADDDMTGAPNEPTFWCHVPDLRHFHIEVLTEWSVVDLAVVDSGQVLPHSVTSNTSALTRCLKKH